MPVQPISQAAALLSLGGVTVLLELISSASTAEELQLSLQLLRNALDGNPTYLMEMERQNGYECLGAMLVQQQPFMDCTASEILFQMAGFNYESPELSLIANAHIIELVLLNMQVSAASSAQSTSSLLAHARLCRSGRGWTSRSSTSCLPTCFFTCSITSFPRACPLCPLALSALCQRSRSGSACAEHVDDAS